MHELYCAIDRCIYEIVNGVSSLRDCGGVNIKIYMNIKIRSTEGAVRGLQYGPSPSIQPEKLSFEGCIEGLGHIEGRSASWFYYPIKLHQ